MTTATLTPSSRSTKKLSKRGMGAPVGAVVRLTYDVAPHALPLPSPGVYILSTGGSAYRILSSRETRRAGRYALGCLKVGGAESIPACVPVLPLYWYPRGRKPKD